MKLIDLNLNRSKMLRIALTSESAIKIAALREALTSIIQKFDIKEYQLIPIKVSRPEQCPQPFNLLGGKQACDDRIEWVLNNYPNPFDFHFIISLENFICVDQEIDSAYIIVYNVSESRKYEAFDSKGIQLPDTQQLDRSEISSEIKPRSKLLCQLLTPAFQHKAGIGANKTYGALYHELHPEIPSDNWMKYTANRDRKDYLRDGLLSLFESEFSPLADFQFLRSIDNILCKHEDESTSDRLNLDNLLLHPELFKQLIDYITNRYKSKDNNEDQHGFALIETDEDNNDFKIDYVIGLESHSNVFALPLALNLNAGFVPLRKTRNDEQIPDSYHTKDCGMHIYGLRADLRPGRVLIIDDLLETGDSLETAIFLAEKGGHNVIDTIFIKDVPNLRSISRNKLRNYPLSVLITS